MNLTDRARIQRYNEELKRAKSAIDAVETAGCRFLASYSGMPMRDVTDARVKQCRDRVAMLEPLILGMKAQNAEGSPAHCGKA